MLYTLTAVELKTATDHLINWVARVSTEVSEGQSREENVVMVADGGLEVRSHHDPKGDDEVGEQPAQVRGSRTRSALKDCRLPRQEGLPDRPCGRVCALV